MFSLDFQICLCLPLQPPTGTDTMVKAGVSTNISTKHQCITAMKEYESKSLEVSKMYTGYQPNLLNLLESSF